MFRGPNPHPTLSTLFTQRFTHFATLHSYEVATANYKTTSLLMQDCYVHDNVDKGLSVHERVTASIYGCLFENNGAASVIAYAGGEIYAIGCVTRYGSSTNGWEADGPVNASEGGTGTYIYCIGCSSIGDNIAWRTVDADAKIELLDCYAYDPQTCALSAATAGTIVSTNLTVEGSDSAIKGAGTVTDVGSLLISDTTPTNSESAGTRAIDTTGTAGATYYIRDGSAWVPTGVGWTRNGTDLYYTTGNVGVKISNPEDDLDVVETLRLSSTAEEANILANQIVGEIAGFYNDDSNLADVVGARIIFSTPTNWASASENYDSDIRLYVGDDLIGGAPTELMRLVGDTASVGIGTTGPDRKLDILDASNPQLRLTHTDGSVYVDLQATSNGDLVVAPSDDTIYMGNATADVDYSLTIDGESADGVITWAEDEDQFQVADEVVLSDRIVSATTTVTTTGPTDNLDVAGVNVVWIDTTSNNVTIGGFVNGVDGQCLRVVIENATNNTTLEHAEGTGNQDIYLESGGDETKTASYGGWHLTCNGTHWYQSK